MSKENDSLLSRREFLVVSAAGVMAGVSPLGRQSADSLALVNATLIDGTGAAPVPDGALWIQEGRIVSLGPLADVAVPSNVETVDVHGATVLPGFNNAHVHSGYNKANLKAWARRGVTTVRDMAAADRDRTDLFAFRDRVLPQPQFARLVAVGPMVTVPGGYPIARWNLDSLVVFSPEDARQKVSRLLDDGADLIKIPLESGAIFGQVMPMLSRAEARAIVQVAHERATKVSAHVSVSRDLELALDAGVDDIAHMVTDYLPDELIARMVEARVTWVPTLELWKGAGNDLDRYVTDNLRRFVEAGGKVALGTDYDGAPNIDFDLGMPMDEINYMTQAGMTPAEIIVAGTRNAARVSNLGNQLGTLRAGKVADILVVNGDPLEDIHALTDIRMVLRDGVIIRDAQ